MGGKSVLYCVFSPRGSLFVLYPCCKLSMNRNNENWFKGRTITKVKVGGVEKQKKTIRKLSILENLTWKIWVACAVCFLKPEGCTHCVLLCAPGRLLTITGKRSSLRKWAQHPRVRGLMENPGGVRVGVGCFGKYGGGYALCFLKSSPQFTPYLLS